MAHAQRTKRRARRTGVRAYDGDISHTGPSRRGRSRAHPREDSRQGQPMTPLLSVREVSYRYPARQVLQSVTFDANAGEFIVLMGLNGAGKSTLLDMVAGLGPPLSGEVLLEGRPMRTIPATERSRTVSHLPQGTRQELPFTVEQVVLMGRYAFADRWFESEDDHRCA